MYIPVRCILSACEFPLGIYFWTWLSSYFGKWLRKDGSRLSFISRFVCCDLFAVEEGGQRDDVRYDSLSLSCLVGFVSCFMLHRG
jgi:hypothetical protein